MVDGVGFSTFIKILNSLEIEWVLRTDNDIFKIPKKDEYRFAGIQRCIEFYREFFQKDDETEKILLENEINLKGFVSAKPETKNLKSAKNIIKNLELYKMYLSDIDLENDIFNSVLKKDIQEHFSELKEAEIIEAMQKRKATFMYDFLKEHKDTLSKLSEDSISKPLHHCKSIIEKIQNETD